MRISDWSSDVCSSDLSLTTASSSGAVTVDINEAGSTILSTKLTIDQGEKTSTTAATPAVISDASLGDDAEITIDVDGAGTDAAGLKVTLIGPENPPCGSGNALSDHPAPVFGALVPRSKIGKTAGG